MDVDARAASWTIEETLVAVAGDEVVGSIHIGRSRHGFGDIGMAVAREWRGRGVGSALLAAAIEWAREQGLHKLSLGVFAHNAAAIGLYRKFGFVVEGRRVKQYRRESGELWDAIDMGLLLELRYRLRESRLFTYSPASPGLRTTQCVSSSATSSSISGV